MSVIHNIKCAECGTDLGFNLTLDRGDDLTIEVDPCSTCMKIARDEGRSEGE